MCHTHAFPSVLCWRRPPRISCSLRMVADGPHTGRWSCGEWSLKGEGNANLVYQYVGTQPDLVGKVLKVRKRRAVPGTHVDAALEQAVWAPVLGREPATQMQRELLYVRYCLVPLLGADCVPQQVPVQVPADFLGQLLHTAGPRSSAHTVDFSNPTAVLMPDVSLFPSVVPPGAPCSPCGSPSSNISRRSSDGGSSTGTNVDIAMCSSSSMDVAGCGSSGSIHASFSVNSSSSSEAATEAARQTEPTVPWAGPAAVGPTLCVEVKPKCGFVETCATVHPDNHIKHSRSRYQLHQLLKVSEGKVAAPSSYDPLDLFSQDPARMLCALRALFSHPQNNLKLFLGGRPVGVRQGVREWADACSSSGSGAEADSVERAAAEAGVGEEGEAEEQLVSLLLQILTLEGVLQRLLDAQQQCPYDIEGIYALYCDLRAKAAGEGCDSRRRHSWQQQQQQQQVGSRDPSALRPQNRSPNSSPATSLLGLAGGGYCAPAAEGATSVKLGPPLPLPPTPGTARRRSSWSGSGEGGNRSDGGSESWREAVQALLSLPPAEAYALLRQYVVSVTARDCALMVSMQRLACGTSAAQLQAAGHKVVCCAATGGWYCYQVAFVDLDMKPLAKIPKHHALDQRILQAARRQRQRQQQQQQQSSGGEEG